MLDELRTRETQLARADIGCAKDVDLDRHLISLQVELETDVFHDRSVARRVWRRRTRRIPPKMEDAQQMAPLKKRVGHAALAVLLAIGAGLWARDPTRL